MKTLITTILLTAIIITQAYSQGADIRGKEFFIGLTLNPAQTKISLTDINSDLTSKSKFTVSGSADFGYYFSKYIGLGTGLKYSSYKI